MYLVDTDVLLELRRPRPNDNALRWVNGRQPSDLFISVITVMEIARGAQKQQPSNPEHARILDAWLSSIVTRYSERILPITTPVAQRWGRMQIELGRDDYDLAIIATALEYDLTVVTRNVRHFDKTGVAVVNPFDALP